MGPVSPSVISPTGRRAGGRAGRAAGWGRSLRRQEITSKRTPGRDASQTGPIGISLAIGRIVATVAAAVRQPFGAAAAKITTSEKRANCAVGCLVGYAVIRVACLISTVSKPDKE